LPAISLLADSPDPLNKCGVGTLDLLPLALSHLVTPKLTMMIANKAANKIRMVELLFC
jgi:hypothetical protein